MPNCRKAISGPVRHADPTESSRYFTGARRLARSRRTRRSELQQKVAGLRAAHGAGLHGNSCVTTSGGFAVVNLAVNLGDGQLVFPRHHQVKFLALMCKPQLVDFLVVFILYFPMVPAMRRPHMEFKGIGKNLNFLGETSIAITKSHNPAGSLRLYPNRTVLAGANAFPGAVLNNKRIRQVLHEPHTARHNCGPAGVFVFDAELRGAGAFQRNGNTHIAHADIEGIVSDNPTAEDPHIRLARVGFDARNEFAKLVGGQFPVLRCSGRIILHIPTLGAKHDALRAAFFHRKFRALIVGGAVGAALVIDKVKSILRTCRQHTFGR